VIRNYHDLGDDLVIEDVDLKTAMFYSACIGGNRDAIRLILALTILPPMDLQPDIQSLSLAIANGHRNAIDLLVPRGQLAANTKDTAAERIYRRSQCKNIYKILSQQRATFKVITVFGPLHAALKHGYIDIAKRLMDEYGVKYRSFDSQAAIAAGRKDVVEFLNDRGCALPRQSLLLAIRSGNRDLIVWLYSKGCTLDARPAIFARNVFESKNIELLKWSRGYNPEYLPFKPLAHEWNTRSVAFWSVCSGSINIIRWVLGFDREKDVHTTYTQTDSCALSKDWCGAAAWLGRLSILKWLRSTLCPGGPCPWDDSICKPYSILFSADKMPKSTHEWICAQKGCLCKQRHKSKA
jgi:hypothetical protein